MVLQLPEQFRAGQELNEAEAQALNQLLAENIRNNVYPQVIRRMDGTREAFVECQQSISDYAKRYRFKSRMAVEPKMSQFELALRAVAREHLVGLEWHEIEDQIDEVMGTQVVWDEAKRRLEVLRSVAGQFELDLGVSVSASPRGEPTSSAPEVVPSITRGEPNGRK